MTIIVGQENVMRLKPTSTNMRKWIPTSSNGLPILEFGVSWCPNFLGHVGTKVQIINMVQIGFPTYHYKYLKLTYWTWAHVFHIELWVYSYKQKKKDKSQKIRVAVWFLIIETHETTAKWTLIAHVIQC
jgi:hypothetical protein